jgi:hypothetical protein
MWVTFLIKRDEGKGDQMGDKGKRDKGKREEQKKGKQTLKQKRKQKKGKPESVWASGR